MNMSYPFKPVNSQGSVEKQVCSLARIRKGTPHTFGGMTGTARMAGTEALMQNLYNLTTYYNAVIIHLNIQCE
ncbi:hypothetical protein BEWA_025830 [Theileria equi strain WA]|uniref:Uncharacterized protein n=1 Tax=Theileria equi strain WA TaxID=1537102 RepID=L0AXU2_THEEQ|nr:hypothetical protein BEWA_025830 [Theileria equi strain WA]AFZ79734.1 hypothetical protein BEWA_025830 [Theileria equi strain WA]|eukprot:XP_004829400.1 hypothetical protein BEWA_025830 [Theileria equi strain WA]